MTHYDFIIVGGGTSGCVLANRLSENPEIKVLVIEAGGLPDAETEDPMAWIGLMQSKIDWNYQTIPQPGLNNRSVEQPRGKILGGTSSMNGMLYTRPIRYDFDQWAYQGAVGWNYEKITPYFEKLEKFSDNRHPDLGHQGILYLQSLKPEGDIPPLYESLVKAAVQFGYPFRNNFNTSDFMEGGIGIGWLTANIKDGKRYGAFQAYLQPVLSRPNLTVIPNSIVTRLLLKGNRCEGVEYYLKGNTEKAFADMEVILSAGSVESPKLLLLSGIGPAAELQSHQIPVHEDVAGVGENFHDHVTITLKYQIDSHLEETPSGLCRMALFAKSDPQMLVTDLEYLIMPEKYETQTGEKINTLSLHLSIQRPVSKGYVRLAKADGDFPPLLHPNLLGDRADVDRLIQGIRYTRELVATAPLSEILTQELLPAAQEEGEKLESFVRQQAKSQWHICGSCKMGIDDMSVVSPELIVRGFENLRVADASIMPSVVTGHAQSSIFIIGEKASDLIKVKYNL